MNAVKIAAIVLIAAGVLGLVYGGFSYTKETHDVKLGPIEFSVKEKQKVNIPVWGGVGAIVIGGALLYFWRQEELAAECRLTNIRHQSREGRIRTQMRWCYYVQSSWCLRREGH